MDLSFAVHKVSKFSSNPGNVHFEGLVHLLSYIIGNKTLVLKYYAYMKDTPLSDPFIQVIISTDNQLMDFSDYSSQGCPDTGRSTG